MTKDQRRRLLTNFCMALANQKVLTREQGEIALDDYFAKLELKMPIILGLSNLNDPPPPNWRAVWQAHSPREAA